MTEITDADLDDTHWCTSDDVRAEFELTVQGQEPDHEDRIKKATRLVQADWSDVTGGQIPADLPDITADENGLLRDATAYLAASLAHLKYATNIQGENSGDDRHVFLERQSERAFDRWTSVADVKPDDDQQASGSGVDGHIGPIAGDNPIYRSGGDR